MTAADADLKAVADLIDGAEKPNPALLAKAAALNAGKAGALVPDKPRRVVELVDDEDDELPDMRPVGVPSAPAAAPPLPGFPDPEDDAALIECRAVHGKLCAELVAVAGERAALERELGVPPGSPAHVVEKLAVRLLVSGASDAQCDQLKALAGREKRLRDAAELAARRVGDLLSEARRKLTVGAWEKEFNPAARKLALAFLDLLREKDAEMQSRDRLRASGFGEPNGVLGNPSTNTRGQNPTVLHLIQQGWLTSDEARAAAPGLQGLPGS